MKHFLLLLLLCVAVYAAWHIAARADRTKALKFLRRHAPRVGLIFLPLLLLLVAAFYFSSVKFL